MRPSLPREIMTERLAAAFVTGATLVLLIDAAMHLALGVAIETAPPWQAVVAPRAVWVVFGGLLWLLAPRVLTPQSPALSSSLTRAAAYRLVGIGMIGVPVVWLAAGWIVFASRITARASWAIEGRILLDPAYYSNVLLGVAPWLLAGAALLAAARHLEGA
jgi:hypothetical protein